MRYLQVWMELQGSELTRLLLPVGLLAASVFLPGRRSARWAALGVAGSLLVAEGFAPEGGMRLAWVGMWLLIAWTVGRGERPVRTRPHPGGLEAWTVGLPLGLAMLALLVMAVLREDLDPPQIRSATLGVVLIGIGLLHLMLRRDALRALLAFGALGMGLQALDQVAQRALLGEARSSEWAIPIATGVAAALAARLAFVRQRDAGSSWVSDAHDLHD